MYKSVFGPEFSIKYYKMESYKIQAASAAHVFSFMGGKRIRTVLYSLIPESVSHPEEELC